MPRKKAALKTKIEVPAPEPEVAEVVVAPVAEVKAPVTPDFILVKARGSNQYEPFQRIAIPTDYGVPVKMSSWVRVQLDAGVIVRAD